MIVVSNTSPLTNSAAIGQLDLLRHLYDQVHIAQGVWEELNAEDKRWPGRDQVAQAGWIQRHTVQNQDLVTASYSTSSPGCLAPDCWLLHWCIALSTRIGAGE